MSILKPLSSCSSNQTSNFLSFQLLLFGGHGTGGWLSRYDVYHNDCIILDRGEFFSSLLVGFLADVCWMCHYDDSQPPIPQGLFYPRIPA